VLRLIASRLINDQDEEADDVPNFSEFSDPRLVAIYDTVNPIADYETFYLDLAAKLSASSIIDIGCGTGLLTCELARRGHRLIGVEPSKAMLALARRRHCGAQVEWIAGDALRLGKVGADLAIMTGHVPQIIRDDEVWSATLAAISEALGPGGRVAFESRNPLARPWTAWTPQASRRTVEDAVVGPVDVWFQDPEVDGDLVRYEIHYLFARSGEELVSHTELRFRTRAELSRSLSDAGFSVENVFGDWDGRPADAASRELIFVAAT
jgi:SAM-dependent methyltransferase